MYYVFDVYKQIGEYPTHDDMWISCRNCDYNTIADEVDFLNSNNDGEYFYFIRRTS